MVEPKNENAENENCSFRNNEWKRPIKNMLLNNTCQSEKSEHYGQLIRS